MSPSTDYLPIVLPEGRPIASRVCLHSIALDGRASLVQRDALVNSGANIRSEPGAGPAETGKAMAEVLARSSYDEQNVRDLVRVDDLDLGRGLAVLQLRASGGRAPWTARPLVPGRRRRRRRVRCGRTRSADTRPARRRRSRRSRRRRRAQSRPARPRRRAVVASDPQPPRQRFAADHVISVGLASRTLAAVTNRTKSLGGARPLLRLRHPGAARSTPLQACRRDRPEPACVAAGRAERGAERCRERRVASRRPPRAGRVGHVRSGRVESAVRRLARTRVHVPRRRRRRRGDDLSHRVLAGMMGVLSEGGFGHLLCSWVNREGEHWTDAPRRWLEGSGCDALILRLSSETPETYAISWTSSESSSCRRSGRPRLRVDRLLPRPADRRDHDGRHRRAPPSRAQLGRGRGARLRGLRRRQPGRTDVQPETTRSPAPMESASCCE